MKFSRRRRSGGKEIQHSRTCFPTRFYRTGAVGRKAVRMRSYLPARSSIFIMGNVSCMDSEQPAFRWPNHGRCTTRWKPLLLGIKTENGVEFECQSEGVMSRFQGTMESGRISIYRDGETKPLVAARMYKEARAKFLGFIPLPGHLTSGFEFPGTVDDLVIVETWPNSTFYWGGQPLQLTKVQLKRGYFYDFGRYEILVRNWTSFGNTDADFSWSDPESLLPCLVTAFHLHRLQYLLSSS